uniref:CSON011213 protein n=1 Tax=Culicoides sonorensis TaxID=179676 RepID=A0A336LF68_CULSO
MYKNYVITSETICHVLRIIWDAIQGKCKRDIREPKKRHWLLYAYPKHKFQHIQNIKLLLGLLVLYIPFPLFWTLYDQQGSRWIFQATRLDGVVGSYRIRPEQMIALNPLFILTLIPIYKLIIYPILEKLSLGTPLRQITIGGILTGLAFIAAFVLELNIQKYESPCQNIGNNEAHFRFYNVMPCELVINFTSDNPKFNETIVKLDPLDVFEILNVKNFDEKLYYWINFKIISTIKKCRNVTGNTQFYRGFSVGLVYYQRGSINKKSQDNDWFIEDTSCDISGNAKVKFLRTMNRLQKLELKTDKVSFEIPESYEIEEYSIPVGKYKIVINDNVTVHCDECETVNFKSGEVTNVMIIQTEDDGYQCKTFQLTGPNKIHMLWQIPQYILITLGEVMFSVTALEFSFKQVPASMKSILTVIWLCSAGIGNLITVVFVKLNIFQHQVRFLQFNFFQFNLNLFHFTGVGISHVRRLISVPSAKITELLVSSSIPTTPRTVLGSNLLIWIDMLLFAFLAYNYTNNPLIDIQPRSPKSPEKLPKSASDNDDVE